MKKEREVYSQIKPDPMRFEKATFFDHFQNILGCLTQET